MSCVSLLTTQISIPQAAPFRAMAEDRLRQSPAPQFGGVLHELRSNPLSTTGNIFAGLGFMGLVVQFDQQKEQERKDAASKLWLAWSDCFYTLVNMHLTHQKIGFIREVLIQQKMQGTSERISLTSAAKAEDEFISSIRSYNEEEHALNQKLSQLHLASIRFLMLKKSMLSKIQNLFRPNANKKATVEKEAFIQQLDQEFARIAPRRDMQALRDLGKKVELAERVVYDLIGEPYRGVQSPINLILDQHLNGDADYLNYYTPTKSQAPVAQSAFPQSAFH